MITEHPEIGTIQAFLDSELSHDEAALVSDHIAGCDACAAMLAEAEDETAMVFPVLAREFDTLVPTQRLWARINESITVDRRPAWSRMLSFLAATLANPSMAAAASLLIVFGVFAAFWVNKKVVNEQSTASVPDVAAKATAVQPVLTPTTSTIGDDVTDDVASRPRVERAAYREEVRRTVPATTAMTAVPTAIAYLPGEESYVKTISSLSKTVDEQKEAGVLRPSQRVSFERDMAVVNDAIARMKKEVKRNPRNESAKQVLYSSYQNKIDLLNSVSQKEELIASIR